MNKIDNIYLLARQVSGCDGQMSEIIAAERQSYDNVLSYCNKLRGTEASLASGMQVGSNERGISCHAMTAG